MKNTIRIVLLVCVAYVAGMAAQTAVLYSYHTIPSGGTVANCPAVIAGVTAECTVAAGHYWSSNGGAWTLEGATVTPTGFVKTVQGKSPDVNGNIQLSAVTTQTATTLIQ